MNRKIKFEFEKFFNINLDLLCISDLEGNILEVNNEWENTLYFQKKELIKKNLLDLIHPDDKNNGIIELQKLKNNQPVLNFIARHRRKDGTFVYLESRAVRDGDLIYSAGHNITQRVISEKVLNQNLKRYTQTAEVSNTFLWEINKEGLFTYVSPVVKDVLGYFPEDLINKSYISELSPQEEKKSIMDLIKNYSEYNNFEKRLKTKDNKIKWVFTSYVPIKTEMGKIIGFRGADKDINKQKEFEIGLLEKNKMLEHLFNQSMYGFFLTLAQKPFYWNDEVDKEKKLDDLMNNLTVNKVNKAMLRQYGYKTDSITGYKVKDFFRFDIELGRKIIWDIHEKGRWQGVTREKKIDGSNIWIEGDYSCIYDDAGKVIGHFGVQIDITNKIKAQEKSQKELQIQKIITDISTAFININIKNFDKKINELLKKSAMVFDVDRSYIMLFKNNFNYIFNTHEYCMGGVVSQKENFQNFSVKKFKWWKNQIFNKKTINIEDVNKLGDLAIAEKKVFLKNNIKSLLTVLLFNDEQIIGFFGFDSVRKKRKFNKTEIGYLKVLANIISDAFKKIDTEKELIKAKEQAETANFEKSKFLANMSHEIRTPLNAVVGFADLLAETEVSLKQKEYIKTINNSGHILMELINNVLDFSKIEAGKIELENIVTDIKQLIKQCVDILYFQARKKSIKLKFNFSRNVPTYALVDPVRLKQVIINLLNNAIKFTKEGEVSINLDFTLLKSNMGTFYFEIKDTGIGISDKEQEKLFKAFSQADVSTTRKYGGTGLGLIISNFLVKKMGGKINVLSEINVGSKFYFEIDTEYKFESEFKELVENNKAQNLHNKKYKILIADDVVVNLELLKIMIKEIIPDSIVFTVENGKKAFEYFKKDKFDFILMDVQMPVMDGISATKSIRKLEKGQSHTKIIALSAGAIMEEKQNCLNAGMDDFLAKPFKQEELADIIRKNIPS
ncbi:MAG: PAS domain S-box protein [Candidatus Muiribacteriota bacterium]